MDKYHKYLYTHNTNTWLGVVDDYHAKYKDPSELNFDQPSAVSIFVYLIYFRIHILGHLSTFSY